MVVVAANSRRLSGSKYAEPHSRQACSNERKGVPTGAVEGEGWVAEVRQARRALGLGNLRPGLQPRREEGIGSEKQRKGNKG